MNMREHECFCQNCLKVRPVGKRDDSGKIFLHVGDIVTITTLNSSRRIVGRIDMIGNESICIDASEKYNQNIVTVDLYNIEAIHQVEDK